MYLHRKLALTENPKPSEQIGVELIPVALRAFCGRGEIVHTSEIRSLLVENALRRG